MSVKVLSIISGLTTVVISFTILGALYMVNDINSFYGDVTNDLRDFEDLAEKIWQKIGPLPSEIVRKKRQYETEVLQCICLALPQQCPSGPPGPRGRPGSKGINGLDGVPGTDGLPGAGYTGLKSGTRCIRCPVGPPGLSGAPGSVGPRGPDGAPGNSSSVAGSAGPRGPMGPRGHPGQPGRPGSPGNPGSPGRPGEIAILYGQVGKPGVPGQPGSRGLPGPSGKPGAPGRRGDRGKPGRAGPSGSVGITGPPGKAAEPGPDGGYCPCPSLSHDLEPSGYHRRNIALSKRILIRENSQRSQKRASHRAV